MDETLGPEDLLLKEIEAAKRRQLELEAELRWVETQAQSRPIGRNRRARLNEKMELLRVDIRDTESRERRLRIELDRLRDSGRADVERSDDPPATTQDSSPAIPSAGLAIGFVLGAVELVGLLDPNLHGPRALVPLLVFGVAAFLMFRWYRSGESFKAHKNRFVLVVILALFGLSAAALGLLSRNGADATDGAATTSVPDELGGSLPSTTATPPSTVFVARPPSSDELLGELCATPARSFPYGTTGSTEPTSVAASPQTGAGSEWACLTPIDSEVSFLGGGVAVRFGGGSGDSSLPVRLVVTGRLYGECPADVGEGSLVEYSDGGSDLYSFYVDRVEERRIVVVARDDGQRWLDSDLSGGDCTASAPLVLDD